MQLFTQEKKNFKMSKLCPYYELWEKFVICAVFFFRPTCPKNAIPTRRHKCRSKHASKSQWFPGLMKWLTCRLEKAAFETTLSQLPSRRNLMNLQSIVPTFPQSATRIPNPIYSMRAPCILFILSILQLPVSIAAREHRTP